MTVCFLFLPCIRTVTFAGADFLLSVSGICLEKVRILCRILAFAAMISRACEQNFAFCHGILYTGCYFAFPADFAIDCFFCLL